MQQFSFLSAIWVIITLACTFILALDVRRNRQKMAIMEPVWILTALWAGAFGLWAYYAFGQSKNNEADKMMKMDNMADMADMDMTPMRPKWQSIVLSTLHCGAGCTLADILGVWLITLIPVTIGGSLIFGSWVMDYILALIIGIGFQYAAIKGMERISPKKAIIRAAKADFLSLTAWQIGMYAWIGLVAFGFNNNTLPPQNTLVFWFMMQMAMACGFLVALPVNVLLIRMGIKRAM